MKPETAVRNSRGATMILRRLAVWAVFSLAYLLLVWNRWPRGPALYGLHIAGVALCFIAATVAAIVTAVAVGRNFRTVPWPLRIFGFIPLACVLAVFVFGPPEFD
jgi:hypothetical protein